VGARQQQLRLAFLKALARVEGEGALAEMEEVADGLIREDPGREAFVRRIEVGAFLRERAWRKAEMHLRALADGAPDDRVVAVGLAECAQGQGRLPEAAERYRRVLEGMAVDGPERWELGVRLAEVLATEGRVEGRREAEEVLRGLPARFEELAPEGLRARRVAVERTLGVRREGAGSR
jgi:predicted Zn-dependent protease